MSQSMMHTERHMVYGPPIRPGEPHYSEYRRVVADSQFGTKEITTVVIRRYTCGHYCMPDPNLPPPAWVHGVCICPYCLNRTGGQVSCAHCNRALNATMPLAYDQYDRLICGRCADSWLRALQRPHRTLRLLP